MLTFHLSSGESVTIDADSLNLPVGVATVGTSSWRAHRTENGSVYAVTSCRGRPVLLHRVVSKARTGQRVRFVNGDSLDCRRQNLTLR